MSEQDQSAGKVKKGEIVLGMVLITHDEAPEVVEPGEEPFDFPALAVAAQATAVVEGRLGSTRAMGCQKHDVLVEQPLAQRVAVVSFVGDQAQGLFFDQRAFQGGFDQGYFRW